MKNKIKKAVSVLLRKSYLDECPKAQVITEFMGGKFFAGNANKIEAKILSSNGYDPENLTVCKNLIGPGSVCLDVGANIGIYSCLMAIWSGSSGSVHAFEPVNHIRRKLDLNVRINRLRNVRINSIVLGEKAGTIEMNQVREGHFRAGTSTLTENESVESMGKESFDRVEVEMMTVDEYLDQKQVDRVDFVKVDIEGYEINFLKGASRLFNEYRPNVLIEHNQKRLKYLGINEAEFKAFFDQARYRCFELYDKDGESYFIPYDFDRKMRGINLACVPV
ncbi:FkbM family methyltransferase [Akkermansiaceae bacterium]|nr:FkbM family methyltransferase [Akkermansiaceae bacterium]